MISKGDLVRITLFDDGNQIFENTPNVWRVINLEFNGTKSIIENTAVKDIKARSISTWKLTKIYTD